MHCAKQLQSAAEPQTVGGQRRRPDQPGPTSGAVVAEAAELAVVWDVAGLPEPQGPADGGGEALPLDSDDDDL